MTHNYSNISTLQAQSQKLKQIPNCREPVVRDASGTRSDKIQLQLETINNQTYIIMEDVNLLKHKLLRGRGVTRATGSGRARRVTSFARRGKKIIASICSFLF